MNNEKLSPLTCVGDGIYCVETYYLGRAEFTCCYIIVDNGEAAVVETNTNYAVPVILGSLEELGIKKEQVKYVLLSHIHLDHAGGAGGLMQELPNAQLILHPRGRKHMIEPEKLIQSVKEVYGEDQYKVLYGEIIPIPKERVIAANDRDVFRVGGRELEIFDTPGHAKHHLIIWDKKTRSVFSGDNFGIGYPNILLGKNRLIFPSTSPTQFEPDKALETYKKILDLNPSQVLLTHFGALTDIENAHAQLASWIEFDVDIAHKRYEEGYRGSELVKILQDDIWNHFVKVITEGRGSGPTPEEKEWLAMDTDLNGQGLAFYIDKPTEKPSNG